MAETAALSSEYRKQLEEERAARLAAKRERDDEIESSDDDVQVIASPPKRKRAVVLDASHLQQSRRLGRTRHTDSMAVGGRRASSGRVCIATAANLESTTSRRHHHSARFLFEGQCVV